MNFAADVRAGLTQPLQKELPSKYLYDNVGSALFEVISVLPEYGLTRADERLLRRYAYEIVEQLPAPVVVAELGSGSGKKTRWILEALARRGRGRHTSYCPIEISPAALAMCRRELGDIDAISIVGFEREYLDGLQEVAARREARQSICWCCSWAAPSETSTGRRARDSSAKCAAILQPGDSLLLGTDLEKPLPQLLAAYDDPLGVTRSFNLNLLARINRELARISICTGSNMSPSSIVEARSVEMHLRSRCKQSVAIRGAALSVGLLEGETIWTESSHRYHQAELVTLGERAGYRCEAQWIDREWPFAQSLFFAR